MGVFTQLWLWWLIMFGVIEGAALIKKTPGSTFTAHVAIWASLKDKSSGWIFRRAGLVGFFVWLVYHFFVRTVW